MISPSHIYTVYIYIFYTYIHDIPKSYIYTVYIYILLISMISPYGLHKIPKSPKD